MPEGTQAGRFFVTPDKPEARLTLPLAYDPGNGQTPYVVGDLALDQTRPVVSLPSMRAGRYLAIVVTPGSQPELTEIPFSFQADLIGPDGPTTAGTFTVTPEHPATKPGVPLTLTASWSGVPSDRPATGYSGYPNAAGTLATIG